LGHTFYGEMLRCPLVAGQCFPGKVSTEPRYTKERIKMVNIPVSDGAKALYPDAKFGLLVIKGFKSDAGVDFAPFKEREIAAIRAQHANYGRQDYLLSEPACHYVRFYKRFKKTYHVMLQLESILLKGKSIPDTPPLVQAMFLSEMKHSLLTAGHDLDRMQPPLAFGVAAGGERFTGLAEQQIELYAGDIYMRDAGGVVVSVIYGQDNRTRITQETRNVLFVTYGVEGMTPSQIRAGLDDLLAYIKVLDSTVVPEFIGVI
jgi:DNA/RNA-binding domain of Phe-tRNA-synthetase-like protein